MNQEEAVEEEVQQQEVCSANHRRKEPSFHENTAFVVYIGAFIVFVKSIDLHPNLFFPSIFNFNFIALSTAYNFDYYLHIEQAHRPLFGK